ncbi:MAG TPA: RHS repeat-associated core domain-containing protein, partial [Gemmatimonadaceae bacterium]|nr:RHS repeat-associated core domain-containing protein [Gemmatimonadaceae bacterium]
VGDRHYTWDANGNQLGFTPTLGTITRTIQWDDENRVSSIVDSSSGSPDTTTHFVYNANGERTHKVSSADSTVSVYPNQWVTARLGDPGMDGTRPVAVMTNHIFAGSQRLASRMTPAGEASQRFWYHGDHLSSSNYVTDDAATVDEHVEYFPYGETWIDEQMPRDGGGGSGSPERYLYTGKELDTETGLYYFGARYYDPQTAQWASGDPILEDYLAGSPNGGVFSPINLGLYSYSLNSPIRLHDPDGNGPTGAIACEGSALKGDTSGYATRASAFAEAVADGAATFDAAIRSTPAEGYLIPVYGQFAVAYNAGYSAQVAATGHDPVSGAPVSTGDRVVSGVGAVAGVVALGVGVRAGAGEGGGTGEGSGTPGGGGAGQARAAANATADAAQAQRPRPATAAAYVDSNGTVHTGASGSGQPLAPGVQAMYDRVPSAARSPYHGACAEGQCWSAAERAAGVPPSGGATAATRVRTPGNPNHGTPIPLCPSCAHVAGQIGSTSE